MDKRRQIEAISQSDDDKILLARIYERMTGAEQKNVPAATCFLSKREQAMVGQLLPEMTLHFFGGNAQAERAVCAYIPEYLAEEDWLYGEDGPVCALGATYFRGDELSHRDFLGALMGSGIKRETVGDIHVGTGRCDFFVTREILPYVLSSFEAAGRTKIHVATIALEAVQMPEVKVREISDTVATARLDSLVATGFSISRAKAATLIQAGKASLNGLVCDKPDKLISQGDAIAVRGLGKLGVTMIGTVTKKGRLRVTVSRYE